MAAPRKYPDELRERATGMVVEARQDPASREGVYRRVGEQLVIHPETLRTCVNQADIDQGYRPGTTGSDSERLVEIRRVHWEGFSVYGAKKVHAQMLREGIWRRPSTRGCTAG